MKALILVPLLMAAMPALAQQRVDVRYSDLDLTQPRGVTALDERLVKAARKVCRPDQRDLVAVSKRSACTQEALTQARTAARAATATAQARAAMRASSGR